MLAILVGFHEHGDERSLELRSLTGTTGDQPVIVLDA
jgi:hypothetical protein